VTDSILRTALASAEAIYRQIFDLNARLMRFLTDIGQPLPVSFRLAAEVVLNTSIRREIDGEPLDVARIEGYAQEARETGITLATQDLSFALQHRMEAAMDRLQARPEDTTAVEVVRDCLVLAAEPAFEIDLWRVQNAYYELAGSVLPRMRDRNDEGDEAWIDVFRELGTHLGVRVGG